jgi:hypothetical protein
MKLVLLYVLIAAIVLLSHLGARQIAKTEAENAEA